MAAPTPPPRFELPPVVRATLGATQLRFTTAFRIGRAKDCEFRVEDEFVSRYQAEVVFENGQWFVRDLGSSNGIFSGGQRIQHAPIADGLTIRLGVEGPEVSLLVERVEAAATAPPTSPSDSTSIYLERYFGNTPQGENFGEHTLMVRKAFKHVQTKQKRKYRFMLVLLALAVACVGSYAFYQDRKIRERTAIAQELFYAMKSLDVDIANVEKMVLESQSGRGVEQVSKYRSRRKEMESNYDRFLTTLKVYDPKMTEEQRLILRVARIFGECELAIPDGFMGEVQSYIKKWQSSARLSNAVRKAQENGYITRITDELLARHLPPQFFYLALQESDFDPYISGPMTRMGIAKGMWQFIPETGMKYGLQIGPLADFRRPDPADDRHNWQKATTAAAHYLKDIYTTDAQASGLLVMASYNWGEDRVVKLLRTMPANPRDRNFWKLLEDYRGKVPDETYNYVYYIFSAAVIGENPQLFGFKFDGPLKHLEGR